MSHAIYPAAMPQSPAPSPDAPSLADGRGLDPLICYALYSANHAMQRVYTPLLSPLGLTYPQYLVLAALWTEDGQTVGALSRALRLETNTLTPLLKRMEAQGLLSRARSARDERQVIVTLSPRGAALRAESGAITACILEACGMDLAELDRLRRAITDLRDRLAASG